MATTNKAKIPVGFVLSGKYRVTRELGRGGMAAVYEAENVDIGKRVAIKVLAQELTSSTVVVERFLREARAAAAIRSPYICDVYDSGRLEDGRPFLVLELLEGESLYERMTKVRYIDLETTLGTVTQTCRGLTKAHLANIVHRDLKPENIFITKDEESRLLAKILDFGLAKFYSPVDDANEKQARLTREGAVFGTPAYMSPEQVRGQGAVDHRADLWALGCITYECLTGKTVWSTEQGVAMTFAQIANSPLPDPQKLRPDLPRAFSDWFFKALDRDIDNRFQTAKEFAEELSEAFSQGPPSFSAIHDVQNILGEAGEDLDFGANGGPDRSSAPRRFDPAAQTDPGAQSSGRADASGADAARAQGAVRPPDGPRLGQSSGGDRGGPPTSGHGAASLRGSKAHFAAPDIRADERASDTIVPPFRRSGSRVVVLFGLLLLVAGGAYVGYRQFFHDSLTPVPTASTLVAPSAAPVADAGGAVPGAVDPSEPTGLPWRTSLARGQKLLAEGEAGKAAEAFKEAFDNGGHGVPRTMLEHIGVAVPPPNAATPPCQLVGLARPRAYDLMDARARVVAAGRPSIALGPKGPLFAWTDAREGVEHAYAVVLDEALRPLGEPVDVTPEGVAVAYPMLYRAGDRFILSYWDAKGPEAGVHVRWLDASGRIAGPPVQIAPEHKSGFWPTLAERPGGYYVVWTSPTDASVEDLFLRRLNQDLAPEGEVVRLTDLLAMPPLKSRARYPSAAVIGDSLHIVYKLDRNPNRLIQHLRLPLTSTDQGAPARPPRNRDDLFAGQMELVNTDQGRADSPQLVCGGDACFIVWHGETGDGAWAAYLDPKSSKPIWRKRFTKTGGRPALGISPEGRVQLAWYERGKIVMAKLTRDGLGDPSTIARVSGDQPAPSIAPGAKPGEWLLAWLDYETGHLEPYGARTICK